MTAVLFIVGAVSLLVGVAMIFVPAAFIVGGAGALWAAIDLRPGPPPPAPKGDE